MTRRSIQMVACSLHTDCQRYLVVGWWWSTGSTWGVSPCVGVGVGVGVGVRGGCIWKK